MEETSQSIVEKIFELLRQKGISQKKLSDLTGISTSAISDWKHRGSVPSAYSVKKICEALNVEPEMILGANRQNSESGLFINEDDTLYEFVKSCKKLDNDAQKRIVAYAMAMMKVEV